MIRTAILLVAIFPALVLLAGCDKVTTVETDIGKVRVTDRGDDERSHVKIECNNGLIIEADWQRNAYNDFGYDVFEPSVSESYNRLAVMVTVRSAIANSLNGNYE